MNTLIIELIISLLLTTSSFLKRNILTTTRNVSSFEKAIIVKGIQKNSSTEAGSRRPTIRTIFGLLEKTPYDIFELKDNDRKEVLYSSFAPLIYRELG